jgi:hypothetical protein
MHTDHTLPRLCLRAAPAVLVLFAGVTALRAQAQTASLSGVVTDPSGSAIPAAVVNISEERGPVRSTQSDAHGRYDIGGIAPGVYDVRASAAGFAPFENKQFRIESGSAQTLNIAFDLQARAEQVTVSADAAKVDTDPSNNAGALKLQGTDLDALPDDPDDLSDALAALAGPAPGPNGGQFFIDGFTGGLLPPKQSIREIRINQNPFAAEFDRPGQGRVEILTKPGADAFHGTVMFQFSNSSLISRNPFVTVKPPYQRRQWESQFGGPLGNKTSFTANFVRRDITEDAFVNATILDSNLKITPLTQSVVTPFAGTQANIKIDRTLSANHTLVTLRLWLGHDAKPGRRRLFPARARLQPERFHQCDSGDRNRSPQPAHRERKPVPR